MVKKVARFLIVIIAKSKTIIIVIIFKRWFTLIKSKSNVSHRRQVKRPLVVVIIFRTATII